MSIKELPPDLTPEELKQADAKFIAPPRLWHDPKTEKPEDGEIILIREYYKSPRYGKFVNNHRVITYFDDFGFKHEEKMNRDCYGYRITHWLRIPPVE